MGFQVLTADSNYSICEAVGKRGQEEQCANAQLIATAPELLELLTEIDRLLNKIRLIEEGSPIHDKMKILINKALGKEESNE